MGFSTSGAVAIILVGTLVAASVFIPTLFSIGTATGDAFSTKADTIRDTTNTAIAIDDVERNESEETVNVTVVNDGTQTLELTDTDLLVNGEFVPLTAAETAVSNATDPDGESIEDTLLWPPGTTLTIELSEDTLQEETETVETVEDVERILVVAPTGVADGTNTSEAS